MTRPVLDCGYAEMQTTTNFSFLRGASHPHELVAQAKALDLAALAVTDRNTLAGVVRAHVAAKAVGLRFIVGARLDLQDAPSLLCLPTDRAAYGRLSRLLSEGQMRADKGACTLFLADVAAHAAGQIFIVLADEDWDWRREPGVSAAMPPRTEARILPLARTIGGSSAPAEARHEGRGTLAQSLRRCKSALSPAARVYLAASHTLRGDDKARIATLAGLARRLGMPLVATGDALYHTPHRRPLQDVLSAIREHTTVAQAGLRLEANAERHLKPPREMVRLFKGHEEAIARTLEIMNECRFSLDDLTYEYPDEPVPAGSTPQAHLEALTWEGARQPRGHIRQGRRYAPQGDGADRRAAICAIFPHRA